MTSPAATQSMSSPGRILYRSAIFFGRVTWYLDVTLAMRVSRTPVYPYHSKDQILVQQPAWPLFPVLSRIPEYAPFAPKPAFRPVNRM